MDVQNIFNNLYIIMLGNIQHLFIIVENLYNLLSISIITTNDLYRYCTVLYQHTTSINNQNRLTQY